MEEPALASLSLTHVSYNPADWYSYMCAWLALTPQALCVAYAILIWSTREVEVISMFIGQMACEGLNWGLKRWIKEERPQQMNGKGYGMPSSHAQFVAFFSVSLSLFLMARHTPHPTRTHTPTSLFERGMLSLTSIMCALAVAYSRVYLNYHTEKQVLVGCGAGTAFALVWFAMTSFVRSEGYIWRMLNHPAAEALRIRDLVIEEDLPDSGWARWVELKKKRNGLSGKKSK
ncbi:PAP2-domain-containing protein [Pseudovirgaria hyperparasitica]|uniref:Dolichyldiphosphatase n=1 Tax=Pseudovirgaria hyperparasitica TaxID=470096 RepID=A0A6A6VY04_9PEZI|nr:PAP2-domain-containing protein [Pseudovirgaria hyperparasitica]KAF2755538.1 PAP2-domain-containing protein [Pseudovirgaria hyperparasitica]